MRKIFFCVQTRNFWKDSLNVTYVFVLSPLEMSRMSCLSYLNGFKMGGRRPYRCCFVECCFQDLFNISLSILVWLPSSFFSIRLVSVYVVHPYSSMKTTVAWKKLRFILSDRFDFLMTDNLLRVDHALASCVLMSFSVDRTLLPRKVNLSTSFRKPPFLVEMSPLWLKLMFSVLSSFTWRPVPHTASPD